MANLENNRETEIKKENSASPEAKNVQPQKPLPRKSPGVVRLFKGLFWGIVGFLVLLLLLINLPPVQDFAATKGLEVLKKEFNVDITKDRVRLNLFGSLVIDGLNIADDHGGRFLHADALRVETDWFSLLKSGNHFSFNGATLLHPDVHVLTYKGDSIDSFTAFIEKFDDGKPRDPNKPPFRLDTRIQIINGQLKIENQNLEGEAGHWLEAKNLNLLAPAFSVAGPNISAKIGKLAFDAKRWGKGYQLETFSGNFVLTRTGLALKELTFNTDHSLLQGDLAFHFDEENQFRDFADKVKWDLNLKPGSQISGHDISYFVQDWDNDTPINLSAKMDGPLNNFTLQNLDIHHGEAVQMNTDQITFTNLLKGDFRIDSPSLRFDMTYPALREMFPGFIAESMGNFADAFGMMHFEGNATVLPTRVDAAGQLKSDIGSAVVKSFTLTGINEKDPQYIGQLTVTDLNTTAFTDKKEVGKLSGNMTVQGQGFDLNTLSLTTDSRITQMELLGKVVHDINVKGKLDHKKFEGVVQAHDSRMAGTLDGLFDFSSDRFTSELTAQLTHLDTGFFTGQKDAAIISGTYDGKFSLSSFDDLQVDGNLSDLLVHSGASKLHVPDGHVKVLTEGKNRRVEVDAPGMLAGNIDGNYNLSDLADIFGGGIKSLLAGQEPSRNYKGQIFNFDFKVEEPLVRYFVPELRLPQPAVIRGNYVGDSHDLVFNVRIPKVLYEMYKVPVPTEEELKLAEENPDYKPDLTPKLTGTAEVNDIYFQLNSHNTPDRWLLMADRADMGANHIKNLIVKGTKEEGEGEQLAVTSTFSAASDGNQFRTYAVNLQQTTTPEGNIQVKFRPTTIDFGAFKWAIDTDPELDHFVEYRKKTGEVVVHNLRMVSEESSVEVDGIFKNSKDFDADIVVDNLSLDKIFAFIPGSEDLGIKGIANGRADITMSKDDLQPIVDLKVTDLVMNDDTIGDFTLKAKNSSTANVFDVDAKILTTELGKNTLSLTGTVDNRPKTPTLDLVTSFEDFDLSFAQQFLKSVFRNFRGKAKGDVNITGPINNIDYNGIVRLSDFGFTFDFTNVDYQFEDTDIPVSKGLVQLNDVTMRDGRSNSSGSVSGIIQFESLSSIGLNLLIRSDNLLLLNTQRKNFDTFWGRIMAEGDIYVSGPVDGLNLDANARVLRGSEFTMNTSSSLSVEEFKMLRFLKIDEETGEVSIGDKVDNGLNMSVGLILSVDKNSTVRVLVGDDMGDIDVRGDAKDLRFNMNRTGQMTMNGTYVVDNGTFLSKAVLKKEFQIEKNSSISWDGNVMNPDLNIVANYTRMVSNLGEYLNVGRLQATDVQLQIKLQSALSNINPQMEIKLPSASSQIREALAAKVDTEDEKIKQIGSILVLNSFNTTASLGELNFENTAISTGYSMLFKNLSSVFNTLSKDFQIDIDYISGNQTTQIADRANTSVNIALSPRLKIKTGIGIPIAGTVDARNNYLSGEGTIEYDVSRLNDGSLVVHAYSKPTNIGLIVGSNASDNQSYGVGFAYSKSFDKIGELFVSKKKEEKRKEQKAEKAAEPASVEKGILKFRKEN